MDLLQQFYVNEPVRTAVMNYLDQVVREMAVDALFTGKDAKGIAEARSVILEAHKRLRTKYEPQKEIIKTNSR
jgi:hypothetical protein